MNSLIIRNCRVFDGHDLLDDGRPLDILMRHGRIEAVGKLPDQPSYQNIDGSNCTAIPGLIDAHFHACSPTLAIPAADMMPESLMAQHARVILEKALRRGFTSVRDMGGADSGLHQAIELGLIQGPRLFFAGKAFSQTGGHGDLRNAGRSPIASGCTCSYHGSLTQVVDGADALRTAVRETLRQGAHHIKLMLSGGVLSPTDPLWMPQYSDAEIRAAVEEAESRRCYVAAHAHTAEAAIRCAELGIRSIEHGTLIDAQAASRLAKTACFVVPTLSIIDALLDDAIAASLPPGAHEKVASLMEQALAAIGHCQNAGIPIGFGTDLLGDLHPRQNREFSLRQAIQAPIDILRSATSINARLLNREGELGIIAPGAVADLILVAGDPLQSLDLLTTPEESFALIISRGKVITTQATTTQ